MPGRRDQVQDWRSLFRARAFVPVMAAVVALVALLAWAIAGHDVRREFFRSAPGHGAGLDAAGDWRLTRWPELLPKDWDPYEQLRQMQKEARTRKDGDAQAVDMMKKVRRLWDDAPANTALDGVRVRIPGYLVPLDNGRRGITELLLVPYFGACIHSPPPPSSQIIHVTPREPLAGLHTMDTVWIAGTLRLQRSESTMGVSGWAMEGAEVEPYVSERH